MQRGKNHTTHLYLWSVVSGSGQPLMTKTKRRVTYWPADQQALYRRTVTRKRYTLIQLNNQNESIKKITKYIISLRLRTEMNWLDFEVKKSKVKVTGRPRRQIGSFGVIFSHISRMQGHILMKLIRTSHYCDLDLWPFYLKMGQLFIIILVPPGSKDPGGGVKN